MNLTKLKTFEKGKTFTQFKNRMEGKDLDANPGKVLGAVDEAIAAPAQPEVLGWLRERVPYWTIDPRRVEQYVWYSLPVDYTRLSLNNVFRTKEDAELALEYRTLQAIGERTKPEVGTWRVSFLDRIQIAQQIMFLKSEPDDFWHVNDLHFPTKEQCQRFIDLTPRYLGMVRDNQ